MGHCMGFGGVIPLVRSRGKAPKAPTILRYLKPDIAFSGLFFTRRVTQNKGIATSKDTMKDCQPEEKLCCLKNQLTYPNKHSKLIFLHFSFLKNEGSSFSSFKHDIKYVLC